MPDPKKRNASRFRRRAPWLAIAAACGLVACMETAATAPRGDEAEASAPREKAAGKPGVPAGCTRVWSVAAADSVPNCPDLVPPSPD
jgi:hypothetical protein